MLHRGAVSRSVLLCVAVYLLCVWCVLLCVAVWFLMLFCLAVSCCVWQCVSVCFSVLQCVVFVAVSMTDLREKDLENDPFYASLPPCTHTHTHTRTHTHTHTHTHTRTHTIGWQRYTGCLKMQASFRKRATNYRALLQKLSYIDEASYTS